MGKNVAVFVDVANIFYAAKAAGVDVDYVDLLKHSSAGRDLVRAYAYTGLDPENENQRNFHSFLARHGYKVVSKDIRKYGDGKVKANLDIELVVDMMKTARNLDIAIVVSGDGDFAPAIRAVQEMGVRVEVISFRGNTSSDLIEVADLFTDITKVASSDRSAVRERAADEADLSMTVVPEKESEGTGRGRGRGRGRTRVAEAPRAEEARRGTGRTTRTRSTTKVVEAEVVEAPAASGRAALVALPGEKLSKAAARPAVEEEVAEEIELEAEHEAEHVGVETGEEGEAKRRRRRRRGGRGRGRGHDRGEIAGGEIPQSIADLEGVETIRLDDEEGYEVEEEPLEAPAPSRRPTHAFGSVWDSQLGMAGGPRPASSAPSADEELEEEPAIPEYLIAERRGGGRSQGGARGQSGGQGGRGGRGGRSGYSAAVDRERFGSRGGGRMPEPSRGGPRPQHTGAPRAERIERPDRAQHGAAFSDVPPELEAMLRAQMAAKAAPRPGETPETATRQAPSAAAPSRRGGRRPAAPAPAAAKVAATAPAEEKAAPSTGGRGRGRAKAPAATGVVPDAAPATDVGTPAPTAEPKPRAGRGRKAAAPAAVESAPAGASPAKAAPTPARGRRAAPRATGGGTGEAAPAEAPATPARGRRVAPRATGGGTGEAAAEARPKRAARARKADAAG